ncbi:zinc finger BED domain-containing protein RICESLEEPER 2 [Tanacetum coccineum]
MARDLLSVQASMIALESAFSTSGRRLEYEEQLHKTEVGTGEAYSISDEEIALDEAASLARSFKAEEEDVNLEQALN